MQLVIDFNLATLIVGVSEVITKQNNLPPECGQQIDGGEYCLPCFKIVFIRVRIYAQPSEYRQQFFLLISNLMKIKQLFSPCLV
jgi:hypothetical protein